MERQLLANLLWRLLRNWSSKHSPLPLFHGAEAPGEPPVAALKIGHLRKESTMSEDADYDSYALPPDAIQEPPTSLLTALRKIGPGIILAGTIVGSGELLLT